MEYYSLIFSICKVYLILREIETRLLVLGAFVKLRKATVSFAMSVCLSVRPPTYLSISVSVCQYVGVSFRMEQLGSH